MSHYFFKLQGTIMNLESKLTVSQITVCETVVTKIYNFKKCKKIHFLFEFLDNTRRWYILRKS